MFMWNLCLFIYAYYFFTSPLFFFIGFVRIRIQTTYNSSARWRGSGFNFVRVYNHEHILLSYLVVDIPITFFLSVNMCSIWYIFSIGFSSKEKKLWKQVITDLEWTSLTLSGIWEKGHGLHGHSSKAVTVASGTLIRSSTARYFSW